MEFNPEIYSTVEGLSHWLFVFAALAAVLLLLALVTCVLSRGFKGLEIFGAAVMSSVKDLLGISLKRIMAIASLTFKEAIRRKALFVFVVFCIMFMFAGWFLTRGGDKPQLQVKLYISFVLTSITWLLLTVMLLLSCWGIPEDIRLRSLHTVVTKPTRRVEIVIGRIFGFGGIGLVVLGVMSVAGYVWIQRQLSERQKEVLTCRVPIYGPLEFLSDTGQPNESGVNVGDTWKYRSYISGTSQARAIWNFEGLTSDKIGESGLELESNFEAFRTHKGNMDAGGLVGQYTLVNNRRAEAFAEIAASNNFQGAANELRLGRYQNAYEALRTLGNRLQANQIEFARPQTGRIKQGSERRKGELEILADGLRIASETIGSLDGVAGEEWVFELTKAFTDCEIAARDQLAFGQSAGDYSTLGSAVIGLSEKIEQHQDQMREHLSRLTVPLPSFVVKEYRFGENRLEVPRLLTFAANNEDIKRFVAKHVSELSEAGQLVEEGALPGDLADRLADGELLTSENALQVAAILEELVEEGGLTIQGDRLAPPEGTSMFSVMHKLVEDGRLSAEDGWELSADLNEDLIHDGQLRVEVACLSRGQFLGMARPDLFIRLPDRPFASGYFKAVASIGMMMILIVTIGVCASCFVKGPIAIFLTLSLLMVGQPISYQFMEQLVGQQVEGGGFVEAVIRMAKQLNPSVPLGINEKVEGAVNFIDETIIFGALRLVKNIIPQFGHYTAGTRFVENGFDVPFDACLKPGILTLLGFVIPCILIGFVSLRFRELEAK
jgi:hypothetical protein